MQQQQPPQQQTPSSTSSGSSTPTSSISNSGNRFLYIKDLAPNQKNINLQVIVLDVGAPTQTKDGHEVRSVKIADKTGTMNLSVWNEYGAVLREGDILRLNGCFTQIWKNSLQIKVGNKGQIIKCGDFMMVFSEQPDMSVLSPDVLKEIQEQQQNAAKQPGSSNTQQPQSTTNQSKLFSQTSTTSASSNPSLKTLI